MSQIETDADASAPSALDAGTYEVLSSRLSEQAAELARRAEALNQRRISAFGGTELRLVGTERIRTEHNCIPRDIVQVGGHMLFGYNVFIGLKPQTSVDDVFAVHAFGRDGDTATFTPLPTTEGLLSSEGFQRDFSELYRYYRNAKLLQLRRTTGRLLAVFQIGDRPEDIKVLRWQTTADGEATYLDNQGDRDHVFPAQHDFEWTITTRDDHINGRHPHVSIDGGEVFVECVGGDLTVKIENNTATGQGVYSEPVVEKLQSLADAEISWSRVGPLILLRIRPYNEPEYRYLVFNTRTKTVVRLDGIGQACRSLPEDQGIIFPGGYYLSTGVYKTFDTDPTDLEFEREVRSPNGEDVLYVFHARVEGRTLLLPYNVIRKEVAAPVSCHGYSVFDDGTMVAFRASSDEPARVHPMQIWQTPFVSDTFAAAQPIGNGPLERLGNAELVRGVSDALSVSRMVADMAPSIEMFEALIATCTRVVDTYYWLGDTDLGGLDEPLAEVRATAEQVLDEYETVTELTEQAATALAEAETDATSLMRRAGGEAPRSADAWIEQITRLRAAQGRLVTLRDKRYIDLDALDALAARVTESLDGTARRAVAFLREPGAFDEYHAEVTTLTERAEAIETVAASAELVERLDTNQHGLDVVTEVVSGLDIGDATVRTTILERIGEVMAGVNRARATLEARRRELMEGEGRAEFAAEFALFGQAVTAGLSTADTPDGCDEQLGRLMLTLENLEARFADFDDFLAELADKRSEIYEAFSSRKQTLLDARARRAERLAESAERVLDSVRRRVSTLGSVDEVNTYFASDPMVAKLREVAGQLRELGETVRAEELDGRVKAARQEAGRSLRDRQDLFDGETIKLGEHRLPVNTQPLDLTLVPAGENLAFSLTGTDYRQIVDDPEFAATRMYWQQPLVSENAEVYRAEYLACDIARQYRENGTSPAAITEEELATAVRREAESRYDEGYERGVHDHDATAILRAVSALEAEAGLLRYPPAERCLAALFWTHGTGASDRDGWRARAASLGRARAVFGRPDAVDTVQQQLCAALTSFVTDTGLSLTADPALAAEYLFEELADDTDGFVTATTAGRLVHRFRQRLGDKAAHQYEADLAALKDDLAGRYELVSAWLTGFAAAADDVDPFDLPEAIGLELLGDALERYELGANLTTTVEGLLGTHTRITDRSLRLRLDELLARCERFRTVTVPGYRRYQRHRQELVEKHRAELKLEEFRPKVMSSFVRNRLLDDVYLPLIGGNLAKQIGAAGDGKRTDQSGMLLLISPPGYGKTTLMEYVADRLGMVFIKVNGPALGNGVTSLDPAEAPNATARAEVAKISFALETGNNAMLYLDDIQHTNPELLQKFISLCDGQRRMEGVWRGRTRTYDLRGKRFAVVMAGNPYTESGQRFRIPDMLANRADVWNLGDVLSGRESVFALSYLENALTSNPVLAPLAGGERADLEVLVRLARRDPTASAEQLTGHYSPSERDRMMAVLSKLVRVQEVVLTVNRAYIDSAARSDASRTEPPFGLQGSYRNMNKMAERIVPVMNDAELEALIDDHYLGEAQTLTSGAEANLLKLAELRGRLDDDRAHRWEEVKAGFRRAQALGGDESDPAARTVGAIGLLADRIGAVESAIIRATATPDDTPA